MAENKVYINRTGSFLPNEPVSNEEMEGFLGYINGKTSKSRRIVLRNNGIVRRFYAIDKKGKATHTNSEMTASAVKSLFAKNPEEIKKIELLSCGTSTPDQMMPSHGVMVHGWVPELGAIEVVSPSGVCCSGMHALKYAFMAVRAGDIESAVSTGSERLSRVLRSDTFEDEVQHLTKLEENPYIAFEKDFLRWMLSDGAAAFLITNKPNPDNISLRVEWIEGVSYAHELDTCMYMASEKLENGELKSYMDYSATEILNQSVLSIKQDVKLLSEHIVPRGFDKLKLILEKRCITVDQLDYFLPHMSSYFFKDKIANQLKDNNMEIPEEKWFSNLRSVGNVGAGSIYLMVDEIFNSGKLRAGEKILLAVPESSRFSYMFALLTVV